MIFSRLCLTLAVSLVAATVASGATAYSVTNLGTLPSGSYSFGYGVNNAGEVTGGAEVPNSERAFLWDSVNGMVNILGGALLGVGEGVNDSGQVVGTNDVGSGNDRAFVWDSTNGMTDLGVLAGGNRSVGYAINNAGQVVGYVAFPGGPAQAFIWDGTNGMQQLISLPGGGFALAEGISESGIVTGQADSISGVQAVVWDSGGNIQGLGFLPGDAYSYGLDVNDAGNVTGASSTSTGDITDRRAFFWDGVTMQDLGVLVGGEAGTSRGWGINSSNHVVGSSASASGDHAFLWDGTLIDLNDLVVNLSGWTLVEARAISDTGFIAGWGFFNGQQQAFLLTPVPEPSTWFLLGGGLAAVILRRRRRA